MLNVERHRSKQKLLRRQYQQYLANMQDQDKLDEKLRKELAATLIAQRILLGISDTKLVEQLGRHKFMDSIKRRRKHTRERLLYEEARRIERDLLTDGRLSTFQRYARIVGMKVNIGIGSERAALVRYHPPLHRVMRHIRTQRRYLADKYRSSRSPRPRRRLPA